MTGAIFGWLWVGIIVACILGLVLSLIWRAVGCKVVGHQPPVYAKKGWYSPGEEYGKLSGGATDGIGRSHYTVECECARCGKNFVVARVHGPKY